MSAAYCTSTSVEQLQNDSTTPSEILSHYPFDLSDDETSCTDSTADSVLVTLSPSCDNVTESENDCCSCPSAPIFSDITDAIIADTSTQSLMMQSSEEEQEIHNGNGHGHSSIVIFGYKIVGDNIDKNIRPRYALADMLT